MLLSSGIRIFLGNSMYVPYCILYLVCRRAPYCERGDSADISTLILLAFFLLYLEKQDLPVQTHVPSLRSILN